MEKFYRLLKDIWCLKAGAILGTKDGSRGYFPISDVWNVEGNDAFTKSLESGWCEKEGLVENSPEWFERVYKVSSLKGMAYVVKSKMHDILSKGVVDDGSDSSPSQSA